MPEKDKTNAVFRYFYLVIITQKCLRKNKCFAQLIGEKLNVSITNKNKCKRTILHETFLSCYVQLKTAIFAAI